MNNSLPSPGEMIREMMAKGVDVRRLWTTKIGAEQDAPRSDRADTPDRTPLLAGASSN